MKKIFIIVLSFVFITGCYKNDANNVIKSFSDNIVNSESYNAVGKMKIISDEEEFNYTFDVKYLEDEYYNVDLINTNNNHEQIILKNKEGVYVITPELNKSYKFQSSWPNNSSQSYLLHSILKDINADENIQTKSLKNNKIVSVKVNYPNNLELSKMDVYFDSKNNLKKVVVLDIDNKERIVTEFVKIDYKANVKEDAFNIENYIKEENECTSEECEKTTLNILEDIVYPLYLPNNTFLTGSEKIGDNSRVILTFSGDKNFTIIEEATYIPKEFEISPVYGEPIILNDTLGVISDNSISWTRGSINYFLTSNDLTNSEMVLVASSMNHAMSVLGSK